MTEVPSLTVPTRLKDPVKVLLEGVAAEVGASRWVLAIHRTQGWITEGSSGSHVDDLYLQLAETTQAPPGLTYRPTTELGSAGLRLDAAGVTSLAVAVFGSGEEAVVGFLEGAERRKVEALAPSLSKTIAQLHGVLPGMLETGWMANELAGISRWVPTLMAMTRGDIEQSEALTSLGELIGASSVVAIRRQGDGLETAAAWHLGGTWENLETIAPLRPDEDDGSGAQVRKVSVSLGVPDRTDWVAATTPGTRPLTLAVAGGRHTDQGVAVAASLLAAAARRQRDLSAARTNALLQERARIASMIHEGITQVLTNVVLQMEVLDRVLDEPTAARKMLASLRGAILEALDSLRGAILELTPAAPEWSDLAGGLERFANDFGAQWGIEISFGVDGKPREVDPEVLALVFGFVQEGLSNIRKHAKTGKAEVLLAFDPASVKVEVLDEGPGFDPARASEEGFRQHQGLAIMRSRARLAGARFEVTSEEGIGTRVTLAVPA